MRLLRPRCGGPAALASPLCRGTSALFAPAAAAGAPRAAASSSAPSPASSSSSPSPAPPPAAVDAGGAGAGAAGGAARFSPGGRWARGRFFTRTHEWFEVVGEGVGTVGITQAAQRALGEVVFCRLPKKGQRLSVMETMATLESVKSVGEVHSPVYGEVIEVNPRLAKEPALVTFAPLTEGWLVRLAFSGCVPRYLQRSRAVARADVEHLLADIPGLSAFLRENLLASQDEAAAAGGGGGGGDAPTAPERDGIREITFDGLTPFERVFLHRAAQEVGLSSASRGRGFGRQLVVRRASAAPEDEAEEAGGEGGGGEDEESPLLRDGWLTDQDAPVAHRRDRPGAAAAGRPAHEGAGRESAGRRR